MIAINKIEIQSIEFQVNILLVSTIVQTTRDLDTRGWSVNRKTEKPNRNFKNRTEPKPKINEFQQTEPNRKPKLLTVVNRTSTLLS